MAGVVGPRVVWLRRLLLLVLVGISLGLPVLFLYRGRYGRNAQVAHLRELALAAMAQEDGPRAVDALEAAAALAPASSDIQCDLGSAYLLAGDRQKALAAFERSAELDFDAVRPRVQLAMIAIQERRIESARELLDWLRVPSRSARVRSFQDSVCLVASRIAYLDSDLDRAVAEADSALDANPRSAGALRVRVRLALVRGEARSAVEIIRQAGEELAEDPVLRILASEAFQELGDMKKARLAARTPAGAAGRLAESFVVRQAELAAAEGGADEIRSVLDSLPQDTSPAAVHYVTALAHVALGELEAAEDHLRRALDEEPWNLAARLERARVLAASHRNEEAGAEVRAVLDQDPLSRRALLVSARIALEDGRLDEAAADAERAAAWAPTDLDAIRLVVDARTRQGRIEEAIRFFDRLAALNPGSETATLGRNLSWLTINDLDSAIEGSERLLSRSPAATGALEVLASAYAAQRGLSDSLARLQRLFTKDPRFLPFRYQLAQTYAVIGRDDLAERELRALLDGAPEMHEARLALASLAAKRRDYAAAIDHAKGFLANHPDSPPGLSLLARTLLASGNPDQALAAADRPVAPPEDPAARAAALDLARTGLAAAVELGDLEAAGRQFEKARGFDPGISSAILAGAAIALGRENEAAAILEPVLREASEEDPRARDAYLLAAILRFDAHEFDEAARFARLAAPATSLARTIVLADSLLALGDRDGARYAALALDPSVARSEDPAYGPVRRALFLHVAETSPARVAEIGPMLHRLLAGVLYGFREPVHAVAPELNLRAGDVALAALLAARGLEGIASSGEARVLLEEANARHPGSLPLLEALAAVLIEVREFRRAAAVLEEATSLAPRESRLYLYLGFARDLLGDDSGALASYQSAVSLDPASAEARNSLAWLLLRQGIQIDIALEHAMRARQLSPDSAQVLDTLGLAQILRSRVADALETLNRAVRLAPREPIVRFHLARAYREHGQLRSALEEIDMAILLGGEAETPDGALELRQAILAELRGDHGPGDTLETAGELPWGREIRETLGLADARHYYRWQLTSPRRVRIRLRAPWDGALAIQVLPRSGGGEALKRVNLAAGEEQSWILHLPRGEFVLEIVGSGEPTIGFYGIEIAADRDPPPRFDREPNDTVSQAELLAADQVARGRIDSPQDRDVFRLPPFGVPATLQLTAMTAIEVQLLETGELGEAIRKEFLLRAGESATLDGLEIPTPDYCLAIRGAGLGPGEYQVSLSAGSVSPESGDSPFREPDDYPVAAQSLPPATAEVPSSGSGRISPAGDRDHLRLPDGRWKIELTAPQDLGLAVEVLHAPRGLVPRSIRKLTLPPAGTWLVPSIGGSDLVLAITASDPDRTSDSPYTLRSSPAAATADLEPNDEPGLASPFRGESASGRLDSPQDRDVYTVEIPAGVSAVGFAIEAGPGTKPRLLVLHGDSEPPVALDSEPDQSVPVKGARRIHLVVEGADAPAEYRLSIVRH